MIIFFYLVMASFGYADEKPYCVALRGNGEYVAGHWGALTKLVEEKGMPSVVAGGSSSSITIFLLNSIVTNPKFKKLSPDQKKKKLALLLKSIPAFFQRMGETDGITRAYAEIMGAGSANTDSIAEKVRELIEVMQSEDPKSREFKQKIQALVDKYFPLLSPEMVAGLEDPKTFSFHIARLKEALAVFGEFKVEGDSNMYFRSGIVDFKYLSLILGTVGDFFAGNDKNAEVNGKLEHFVSQCADQKYKKNWNPEEPCEIEFTNVVDTYLLGKTKISDFPNKIIFENIGDSKKTYLEGIITTAYMKEDSAKRFSDLKFQFELGTDPEANEVSSKYSEFTVNFPDLRFGYMGEPKTLDEIKSNLDQNSKFRNDPKSMKFSSLGNMSYFSAIASSAGEPGLTAFQPIVQFKSSSVSSRRDEALAQLAGEVSKRWKSMQKDRSKISMGGWSDLHPTMVLKSYSGCENKEIIYITRKGGESCFGQTLFSRVITGERDKVPFWKNICSHENYRDWKSDPEWIPATANSNWNAMYHSGNPNSSFNLAVHSADLVYCTDWDSLKSPFKGESIFTHFNHAYESPILSYKERKAAKIPGCSSPLD